MMADRDVHVSMHTDCMHHVCPHLLQSLLRLFAVLLDTIPEVRCHHYGLSSRVLSNLQLNFVEAADALSYHCIQRLAGSTWQHLLLACREGDCADAAWPASHSILASSLCTIALSALLSLAVRRFRLRGTSMM